MRKTEKQYSDPWDRDFYETGSIRPPKERGGLVAVLLVLVILLGGVCSALGIINLRLLRTIAEGSPEPETVYLFQEEQPQDTGQASSLPQSQDRVPRLGLQGQTVSDFDRRFYELPQGVLVTDVTQEHSAHNAGLRAGDVITSLAGSSISSREELTDALSACEPGQRVKLEFYRSQTRQRYSVTVTISEEESE